MLKNLLASNTWLYAPSTAWQNTTEKAGYTNGVKNYSRHMDGPEWRRACHTLSLTASQEEDFLIMIDESHTWRKAMGQIKGMCNGDRSRRNAGRYGFRLPSALDNRAHKSKEKSLNHVLESFMCPCTGWLWDGTNRCCHRADHSSDESSRSWGEVHQTIDKWTISWSENQCAY